MITHLRTPDPEFDELIDFPFQSNYHTLMPSTLRIHYIDEGPKDGKLLLLLHGMPSWSYSFRKVIPSLTKAGFRVVAPDLPGFGKSDKPIFEVDVTYGNMTNWLTQFIMEKEFQQINLFVQDLGGMLYHGKQ